ncbi:hypothetical protein JOF53_000470 [Crossiella equi]|uniref:Uncharacterized protein n=1 Tax=Crossiella equi TaxID=130796 RepID=A0ABS5A4V6_9PSEU|nr:hypothetical protein [Crossiella equi]MBP2471598.1 hypothetical protein [Crossiella equi]
MRSALVLVVFLLSALTPAAHAQAGPPPSDAPRFELRGLVENVVGATARRYSVRDSLGRSMDTAKVIQDRTGAYLAVYHTLLPDGRFHAAVATSANLLDWTHRADFGAGTHQPTIRELPNDAYLVAWEQDPANHIALQYFATRADLLAARPFRTFHAPRRLSTCAEGTPNIYAVQLSPDIDHSTIDLGGHYYANCQVDRQLRATLTNFRTWTTAPQPKVDDAMLHWGVRGNIGDRDNLTFRGFPYTFFEGQYTPGDFGSWRPFLFDQSTGNADRVTIRTNGGSQAFANPAATVLRAPDGRQAVFVSLFIPSENSAPGEAGQLMYYRTF